MLQDDHDPKGKIVTDKPNAGKPRGPVTDADAAPEGDARRNDTDAQPPPGRR